MTRLRPLLLVAAAAVAASSCQSAARIAPARLLPATASWKVALPQPIQGPIVHDQKRVFVATRDGGVRAIEKATGQLAWGSQGRGGFLTRAGGDGLVVRSATGTVWLLDQRTGTPRWTVETGITGEIPAVAADGRLLVSGSGLVALDQATGKELWRAAEPGPFTSEPFVAGTLLVSGEGGGHLRGRDPATGLVRWTYTLGKDPVAPAVVDDRGRILVGTTDGRFIAVKPDGRLDWRWRLGADVRLPAAVSGTSVLFVSHEAVLYSLARGGGNLRWRASLPSRPLSGPIETNGVVIVACAEDELVTFDAATGAPLGKMRMPFEVAGAPLLQGEVLYVPLREPSIVALKLGAAAEAPAATPPAADPDADAEGLEEGDELDEPPPEEEP